MCAHKRAKANGRFLEVANYGSSGWRGMLVILEGRKGKGGRVWPLSWSLRPLTHLAPENALRLDNSVDQRKEKGKQVLSYAEVALSNEAKTMAMFGGSKHHLISQQTEKGKQSGSSGWTE